MMTFPSTLHQSINRGEDHIALYIYSCSSLLSLNCYFFWCLPPSKQMQTLQLDARVICLRNRKGNSLSLSLSLSKHTMQPAFLHSQSNQVKCCYYYLAINQQNYSLTALQSILRLLQMLYDGAAVCTFGNERDDYVCLSIKSRFGTELV